MDDRGSFYSKKNILIFLSLLFLSYLYSITISAVTTETIFISRLTYQDALFIFLVNTITLHLLIYNSFMGLSIPLVLRFIVSMSSAGSESGLSLSRYYLSSYSHGVIELVVYYIIFSFTIDMLRGYIISLKNQSLENLNVRLIFFWRFEYPLMLSLLFIGAIIEVYISNRTLYFL